MSRGHPSLEDLACLAEGRQPDTEARRLQAHLELCPHCEEAYLEALWLLTEWSAGKGRLPIDESLRQAALSVAATGRESDAFRPASSSTDALERRRFWPLTRPQLAGAFAAIAAVTVACLWLLSSNSYDRPLVPETLRLAVGHASTDGMVLPGGEKWADAALPVYRNGSSVSQDKILEDLSRLGETDRLDELSADQAVWLLSGYVAKGRLDMARTYAGILRERFPEETRLMTLEAIIAYRGSELDRCETLLREVVRRSPNDLLTRLNLGLLLAETGREDAAKEELLRVVKNGGESSLARRANSIISSLENR